jgi:hypothetical protein
VVRDDEIQEIGGLLLHTRYPMRLTLFLLRNLMAPMSLILLWQLKKPSKLSRTI